MMGMGNRKQFEIITIKTSTHLAGSIASHFDQYADATGTNYFVRLSPYNNTLTMLCMAIYQDGALNVTNNGIVRRRANGEYGINYATDTYAADVVAGDKYIKVVVET